MMSPVTFVAHPYRDLVTRHCAAEFTQTIALSDEAERVLMAFEACLAHFATRAERILQP